MDQLRGARRASPCPGTDEARRLRRAARSGTSAAIPAGASTLEGRASADVAIIGGGFTGLWTAIRLLEADPSLRVIVCSRPTASPRAPAAATAGLLRRVADHGLHNGLLHFPDELERLEAEGVRNLQRAGRLRAQRGHRRRAGGDGHLRRRAEPWQVDGLREYTWTARPSTASSSRSSTATRSRHRSTRRASRRGSRRPRAVRHGQPGEAGLGSRRPPSGGARRSPSTRGCGGWPGARAAWRSRSRAAGSWTPST